MAGRVKTSLSGKNVRSYSYSESGSPTRLEDSSSFVGNMTVSTNKSADSGFADLILYNTDVELVVGDNRSIGVVTSVAPGGSYTDFTLDHVTRKFTTETTVLPFAGTFENAMIYYLGLMGITATLEIDAAIASREVVNPGWLGNVWSRLKEFFAVQNVEMAYRRNNDNTESLLVREPRQRALAWAGRGEARPTVGGISQPAEYVDIVAHKNEYVTQGEIYAPQDGSVISVDAGEYVEIEVNLDGTVEALYQPECVDWVNDRDYSNTNGVYSVAGNDGLGVPAQQWLDAGGNLLVEMTENPSVMKIKVTGASIPELAPFRIAMTSGEYYNSLHVTADAVLTEETDFRIYTGANPALLVPGTGPRIDNIFVSNMDEAYRVGQRDAAYYSGYSVTVDVPVRGLNQAWSDIAGSTFSLGHLKYRVSSYSESDLSGNIKGEIDITMDDFNNSHGASTMADFNSLWTSGITAGEFSLQILRGGDLA